ncbi:hypothetical protein DFJ58DRAFT_716259 [Suillus subalutaceus]|uniref:uncharacterized protein n=1 Tax=Suillus subalutaceus TaxID=48586 RepID=UPI001B8715DF|nr:uncharacterized protein DFJ58DRAFT_716259 [Suillus subalutaceus]KAG1855180.1 hypothetical protein DFJ58DRAFT_716259 [Suillus subalutaceus]
MLIHACTFNRLCPNCSGEFSSIEAVVLHLNSQSTCWPHEAHPQQSPVPLGLRGSHPSTSYTTGHFHPHSGYVQEDQYNYRREVNTYYPFHDEGEWELARFLVENLNQMQIDKFLKLKWLNTHPKPSFTSKDQLLDWMDALPCFAEWKVSNLEFTTIRLIQLIWRDALEVVKQLFSDPVFANHITFQPHILNDCLPLGATQVPIILGSDKTPMTRTTGGLEMHSIFITISNLDSEVHSKATLQAWRCIAYMPIAKFRVHPDYQTILQVRLWHNIMPDPSRFIHYVFMPLVAHVCNLPEASMIAAISKTTDVLDLDKFQKAAKAVNLSGVHMPYLHDWIYACPSVCLTGKILHTCLKLDARFIAQHKRVGTHHFTKGITHVNQMTGHEHQDIQCTIVASIAGAAPPRFIHALHALIEFIYLAQIQFILQTPCCQCFRGTVERLGTLMQFLADMTECLLITHCKDLFVQTNWQANDFVEQSELIKLFKLYVLLHSRGASLVNVISTEDEAATTINPALSWISCILPDKMHSVHGPRPVRNHFLKGILSGDALTAFHLTLTPDFKFLSPTDIHSVYSLIDFDHVLSQFIGHFSFSTSEHTCWDHRYRHFSTWKKFRLQLHSAFQPWLIMPSRVVQAYPPGESFPLGNCNNVLINITGDDGQITTRVAQVRLIFQPNLPRASNLIQYYHFVASPNDHPELAIWTVKRSYVEDQHGKHRCGGVVPLTSVTHTVELIPEYCEKIDEKISLTICLESYDCFFLNNFADKESYHTVWECIP